MKTVIELITPTRASELLERNGANRPLRKSWVYALAQAMDRGEWHLTHQGIALDTEGHLLDGQHRLHAIIRHGHPIQIPVTYGLSRDVFGTLDQGVRRRMTDHFADSRPVIDAIGYLARLLAHQKPTVLQAQELRLAIAGSVAAFSGVSTTARRTLAAAAVRAAALMSIVRGIDANYVVDVYNMLVNLQTDNPKMPALCHVFIRYADNKSSVADKSALFEKALKLFDPACANLTKSYASRNAEIVAVRQELRAIVDAYRANNPGGATGIMFDKVA